MPLTQSLALPFLYVVASSASLGWVIYKVRSGHGRLQQKAICVLVPLLLLVVLCVCALPAFVGLVVYSGACLLCALRVPLQGMLPVRGRAVLITGCDSGFGYAFARHLDKLGFRVFAGVLNKSGNGPQELSRICSPRFTLIQLDVTSTDQINSAYTDVMQSLQESDTITDRKSLFLRRSVAVLSLVESEPEHKEVPNIPGLWAVVHNAGVLGYVGDGELLPMSVYKQCMEINFLGPVRLSKAFLPMLRRSKGRLICISSMSGMCPLPGLAAYGSSKAALAMFSGVMRLELAKWGIKLAAIHPSGFKTNLYGTQEKWVDQDEIILKDIGTETKEAYDINGKQKWVDQDEIILNDVGALAKEAYGEDYIRNMKDSYNDMISASSPDLSPVLRDVTDALLAENPKFQYTPGNSAYIIPFIFRHLPLWVYDCLVNKLLQKSKMLPKDLRTNYNPTKKYQ